MFSYTVTDDIARLVFDDGKANAYSASAIREARSLVARASEESKAIILAGRPGRFSAGFDLRTIQQGGDPARELVGSGISLLLDLFRSPVPVVAASTGHALAFGALVLLACDRRVSVDGDYRVGLNEIAIGVALPVFAVELARYRLATNSLESVLLGATFEPVRAAEMGYLDVVVAEDELIDAAVAEASRLAELSAAALLVTKSQLRRDAVRRIVDARDSDVEMMAAPTSTDRGE